MIPMANRYPEIAFPSSAHELVNSEKLYDFMREDVLKSRHAERFAMRDFSIEPINGTPSPHSIDRPFNEALQSPAEQKLWLAKKISGLVMPERDYAALHEGLGLLYERTDVKAHLDSGGTLKLIDSHLTYAGQVIEQIASWQARMQAGVSNPETTQVTIASRIISLFRSDLIELLYTHDPEPHIQKNHGGMVLEDVLMEFGGALLTIPSTSITKKLLENLTGGKQIRKHAVGLTKSAYAQIINRGGQIVHEGSSAAENQLNAAGTERIIGAASNATMELTTEYNKTDGAERIMVVPIFMHCNPFTGKAEDPVKPTPSPFAILEPRIPKTFSDFEDLMDEMAVAGTMYKPSGHVAYSFEKPKKSSIPNVFYGHTA